MPMLLRHYLPYAVLMATLGLGGVCQSTVPLFPASARIEESVLHAMVGDGNCEKGTNHQANGTTCEAAATLCKDTTTDISITVGPSSARVTVTLKVPTGCDTTSVKKAECSPVNKYTVIGSGTTAVIENTQCPFYGRSGCVQTACDPFCINIGTTGIPSNLATIITSSIPGLTVAEVDYDAMTGELCITSSLLKKCIPDFPATLLSCGPVYPGVVTSCTP